MAGRDVWDMIIKKDAEPGPAIFPETSNKSILGTIQQYYTVWCGHPDCSVWEDVKANDKQEVARLARANGWRKTKQHGWICPNH